MTPNLPLSEPSDDLKGSAWRRLIVMRLVLSLLVAVVIVATQLLVTWKVARDPALGVAEFQHNRIYLSLLAGRLNEDRYAGRELAESIEQFRLQHPELLPQVTIDAWGRPFLLQNSGDNVRMKTLGRDGQPGGLGLDADLSTDQLRPAAAKLTLRQFLFEIDSRPVWSTAVVSGLLAGLLTWRELRPNVLGKVSWESACLVVLAWICVSVVVAPAIAFLELIPDGH